MVYPGVTFLQCGVIIHYNIRRCVFFLHKHFQKTYNTTLAEQHLHETKGEELSVDQNLNR